jgi:hypothetical protein
VTEKRKTIVVPDDFTPKDEPVFPMAVFMPWGDDEVGGRDVSQPVGYHANGQPLYAPRGHRFRVA